MRKIMIVEDDRELNNGIAFHIKKAGYEPVQAWDLKTAEIIYRNHRPELILLDVGLPDGDGFSFCRQIREKEGVPILFITARDLEEDALKGYESGAEDYIIKPFSLRILTKKIDVILKKPGKALRIAELCHRAMPYPLLVILHDGERVMFSMAEKRFSRDGKEQVVLERAVHTPWQLETSLEAFYAEADFALFHKDSFRELYFYYMNLLEALICFVITGKLQTVGVDPERRREVLEEIHRLDQEIAAGKSRVKDESELSVLVEWNMAVKNLEQRRREIIQKWKGDL